MKSRSMDSRRQLVILAATALAAGLVACAEMPDPDARPGFDPNVQFAGSGHVEWELLGSSCPADVGTAWDTMGSGTFEVSGGLLRLDIDSMPEVIGELDIDQDAHVTGQMTFEGFTGQTISCDVQGDVQVLSDAIEGEATEALSSKSEVNCASTGRFRLVIDHSAGSR